jgi:hypothetical protein
MLNWVILHMWKTWCTISGYFGASVATWITSNTILIWSRYCNSIWTLLKARWLIEIFKNSISIAWSTGCASILTSLAIIHAFYALVFARVLHVSGRTVAQTSILMKIKQIPNTTLRTFRRSINTSKTWRCTVIAYSSLRIIIFSSWAWWHASSSL